jgi:hypothetical protein
MPPAWWQWRGRGLGDRLKGFCILKVHHMRANIVVTLVALLGSAFAAELPRKSPDLMVQLTDGKQLRVSDYRGKVLCLVFILTT